MQGVQIEVGLQEGGEVGEVEKTLALEYETGKIQHYFNRRMFAFLEGGEEEEEENKVCSQRC